MTRTNEAGETHIVGVMGSPATDTASCTRHHGSHGSAPKRNTYRERYTG